MNKSDNSHNIIRILSKLGVCSRKQAVELVKQKRVKINGRVARYASEKASLKDIILIDNKPALKKKHRYIMLHKPAGYVTTRKDEKDRKTVYELLRGIDDWVFPVGRLDKDSEGLLIFTNDTAFGDKLTDPANFITRTYEVLVDGVVSQDESRKILKGVDIGRGEKSAPVSLRVLEAGLLSTSLEIVLTEGKNREIRRLFEALGRPVKRLVRTRFGNFALGSLKSGQWKELDADKAKA